MTEQTLAWEGILADYAAGPERLEAAAAGLTEEELDLALRADSWTIRQILHHLADGDDLWKAAIKAALGNSEGLLSFGWYWEISQDEWVVSWDYAGRGIEPSLALFRANRRHVVQLLQQIPKVWERVTLITLPDGEERATSVGYVVEMQAQHVLDHIEEIRRIREAHGLGGHPSGDRDQRGQ
jgi:uncharacterized damage-inducible protein DinB